MVARTPRAGGSREGAEAMILLLLDLFVQFAILNVIAFGGITALLPELHRLVVEQLLSQLFNLLLLMVIPTRSTQLHYLVALHLVAY